MIWQISSFPRCEHHVFLSHCAADRADLVYPVHDQLKKHRIIPWLDNHDYSYGRDSRTALKDGLLSSRHAVFFITCNMMNYSR
ncbi:MAG: toll/interleukin-1 receptor domain-containing protein, partial [Planctomycetia bacterium]